MRSGKPCLNSSPNRSSQRGQSLPHHHLLQLFDTDESLTRSVAAFLCGGDEKGHTLLVVATRKHWNGIVSRLRGPGNTRASQTATRVIFWDAEGTLERFMRRGEPDRALFVRCVARVVLRLARETPTGLRIYGEMVDLLAREGNYSGAAQLEHLWNELGKRCLFTLLCGYSAAHFASPDAGSALAAICCEHSHSSSRQSDPLGRFLLDSELKRPTPESPR
jgi:hypothetical protein